MSKLLLAIGALVVGSLILPAALWLGDVLLPLLPNPAAPPAWQWSEEKASLDFCTKQHLPEYDVELPKAWGYLSIDIRTRDTKRLVYRRTAQAGGIVFTRLQDTIFVAEYWAIASGCSVVAVDLETGNRLWETQLQGIGPTMHSEYSNSVNIETDGEMVIVYGNESNGRYVEHLDINTGKMLLNLKLEPLR